MVDEEFEELEIVPEHDFLKMIPRCFLKELVDRDYPELPSEKRILPTIDYAVCLGCDGHSFRCKFYQMYLRDLGRGYLIMKEEKEEEDL